jgi:hypothetical protein
MRQMGNATVLSGLEEIVGISSGQAYSSLRVALFNLRPSGEEWQRRIPRSITRTVPLLVLALVLLCLCGCCWSNILLLSFFCPSCCFCDVRRARSLILDRSFDTPSQFNAASRIDDVACHAAFKVQCTLLFHLLPQHCTTPHLRRRVYEFRSPMSLLVHSIRWFERPARREHTPDRREYLEH